MADNGKRFEQDFEKSCSSFELISIDRFYDVMNGFKSINTISDFVVYKLPYLYYFELKSYKGKKLYWSSIRDNQWNGLMEKSKIEGVHAGILIQFYEHDKHFFVAIEQCQQLKDSGEKGISLDWCEEHAIELVGTKKRTRFSYDDVYKFLSDIARDGKWKTSKELEH